MVTLRGQEGGPLRETDSDSRFGPRSRSSQRQYLPLDLPPRCRSGFLDRHTHAVCVVNLVVRIGSRLRMRRKVLRCSEIALATAS